MKNAIIKDIQAQNDTTRQKSWFKPLAGIVSENNILTSFTDKLAYGRDRWPYGNLQYRFGKLPTHLPRAVVIPENIDELCAVVELLNREKQVMIPYGAGSGVLGAAVPLSPEVVSIDLKRLDKVVELDEISGLVAVEAGINGGTFESYLNSRRLTCGHLPQSLNMSTVGGWLACRGAGQVSSRYGKAEDMVAGMKVVLPNGKLLEIKPVPRRSTGPSLADIFIGAEGTMGIIAEATMRIWPYPENECLMSFAFAHYADALDALRKIMQSGLRLNLARLYDVHESASRIAGHDDYPEGSCLCVLTFTGVKEFALAQKKVARDICVKHGGVIAGNKPAEEWFAHRYESFSAKHYSQGRFMDTIEISARWSSLPAIYESCCNSVTGSIPNVHFSAHWSHIYPDGACCYMTFVVPGDDREKAEKYQQEIWEKVETASMENGGSIAHHHGIGLMRGQWLAAELGYGHELLQQIKDTIDPNNIMNPGKLGLRRGEI